MLGVVQNFTRYSMHPHNLGSNLDPSKIFEVMVNKTITALFPHVTVQWNAQNHSNLLA